MKFANFIPAVLAILGIPAFGKNAEGKESLTDAECDKLKAYGFPDKFVADLKGHLENPQAEETQAETDGSRQVAVVATLLGSTTAQLQETQAELEKMKLETVQGHENHTSAIRAKEQEIATLTAQVDELNAKIKILSDSEETDNAVAVKGNAADAPFDLDNEKQFGGMSGEFWGLDRAYNQRARAALLAAQGRSLIVNASSADDFQRLRDDLGAFYLTSWSDRIQSLLVKLPSIVRLFPTESGHHDLEVLVNIWLGEFSQAGNTVGSTFDKVAKGSFEFDHETLRVWDVMFVHRFTDLKVLEKSWIAYLNREGSNSLKLSFVEYILVEVAKKLHNEREQRWINGVRKDPNPNIPGRAMEAADGLYEYIRKKVEGFVDFTPGSATANKVVYQIKPFDLPAITPGNIGEVIYEGTSLIPAEFRDTGSVVLYVPSYMQPWYIKYNETLYGANRDYAKDPSVVHEFPMVRIQYVPNADNHRRIFWTIDGNFGTYEAVANEMYRFRLEQQDWTLKVWSEWKEGIAATAVGYKYTSKLDMDGSRQVIWCNNEDRPSTYYIESQADSNPSALLHSSIVTVANTSLYTITDIEDAEVGRAITIKCGVDGVNGVKIEKSGKFSLISANWEPSKGDTITLMKRSDGKFVEIARASEVTEAYTFAANDATPSVEGATVFVVGANTAATAITNLQNAVVGTVYTIHGAGSTYASTIANSGNFVLTEAMTLSAGHYIKLVAVSGGKFYEVARG